ncbi:Glycosyltransferase involved in cell wall bisynthesis [Lutibacter agarilyticus]|uniref:Glycosyltransferase involved in cell wall bisynthesis n=1 Tax=Lutibacter agarilyticus TaxID=1109740 RepID=A0A238YUF5_9FLAO|nr:glycosyltransferase [Lutibacter agarilyticus]SNR74700.1 Glycosyltransferase involved in cell wall bisynthesis [Lutibacter agarilyticus]
MKILYILNELRFSGMEMMLANSFLEWKKNDIEIYILATGKEKGEAFELLTLKGYNVKHISFVNRKLNSFLELREYLKLIKVDVVHIHTEANFLMHALNAYFSGQKKIVRTFHSIFKPRLLGKLRRLFDRFIAVFLNIKYISVGDSVAENEAKHFLTKSKVIYNWYDSNRFLPVELNDKIEIRKKLGLDKHVFVITSIGNCSPIKRHELILDAISKLPKTMNWIYLHAGRENKCCDERKLAKELGIYDRCMFLGLVSNPEEILGISDVFIMSSKLEGLGNAAIESIAVGIPTLLVKVPGLNDVLKLVPDAIGYDPNCEALVSAISNIYNLVIEEKITLSKGLVQSAIDLFSISKGVANYANFYSKVIN